MPMAASSSPLPNGVHTYMTKSMSAPLLKATSEQKKAASALAGQPVKKSARERAAEQKAADKARRAKAKADKAAGN